MTGTGPKARGDGGNGKTPDKRSGVDRRITEEPLHAGPERRQESRRKLERLPDKPIKR